MTRALHVGKIILSILILYIMVNIMAGFVLYSLGFPPAIVALVSIVATALIARRSWDRIAQ